jgi:hypothetical protein
MKIGDKISKNFVLDKQITDMQELALILTTQKSIFWRHRITSTSFMIGWPFRTLMSSVNSGVFWTVKKIN